MGEQQEKAVSSQEAGFRFDVKSSSHSEDTADSSGHCLSPLDREEEDEEEDQGDEGAVP